jgi:hypothetical protein
MNGQENEFAYANATGTNSSSGYRQAGISRTAPADDVHGGGADSSVGAGLCLLGTVRLPESAFVMESPPTALNLAIPCEFRKRCRAAPPSDGRIAPDVSLEAEGAMKRDEKPASFADAPDTICHGEDGQNQKDKTSVA